MMKAEDYERVMQIVDAVMDCAPGEVEARVRELCPDVGLRDKALRLLALDKPESKFLEESPLGALSALPVEDEADYLKGTRIGPYKLDEQIGRGGMGAVYRGVRDDEQYRTTVAVKLIKRGMDTEAILQRFRRERQILASLNHPNIARLLDGGVTPDGLSYFVMEYIEGESINQYCDNLKLSIAERLKLFREVCEAVQYAHQNLVIHRDLKPSNILVTKEGVPKLLDFGIAKLLHASEEATTEQTATELRVMTPEYASPEQVKGERITTASDVYSLGVLLYELLTGHRPYRFKSRKREEVAQVICEEEPERPSTAISRTGKETHQDAAEESFPGPEQVSSVREGSPDKLRRRLHGDLDNIVLMALRKEPERRYASVEQFSEDLRRHLEGLPVRAHKATLSYRAAKFIRRHKAGVVAAAIILLTIMGGMAATLWQARVARAERARAERRFNDVRRLANSFMFEFYDEIDKGAVKAKELVVKRALEYLDNLSQESANDAGLQRELATAYVKIGDVQGRILSANLGDTKGALESYRKALALYERLAASGHTDKETQQDLAMSYGRIGEVNLVIGKPEEAAEHFRKALSIYDRLTAAHPDDVLIKIDSAHNHRELAVALGLPGVASLGDTNGALEYLGKAIAIYESIPPEKLRSVKSRFSNLPADAERLLHLGAAYSDLAAVVEAAGKPTEAVQHNRQSIAFYEQALKEHPADVRARRNLAVQYWNIAGVLLKNNLADKAEILALTQKSVAIFEEMSAADPNDQNFRKDVAQGYRNIGRVLHMTGGDKAQAADSFRKSIAIFEELVKHDPSSGFMQRQLAFTHLRMSLLQTDMSDFTSAIEHAQRAVSICEALVNRDPKNATASGTLADSYTQLGNIHARVAIKGAGKERWQEARNWHLKSLNLLQEMKNKGTLASADAGKLDEATRQVARAEAELSGTKSNQ